MEEISPKGEFPSKIVVATTFVPFDDFSGVIAKILDFHLLSVSVTKLTRTYREGQFSQLSYKQQSTFTASRRHRQDHVHVCHPARSRLGPRGAPLPATDVSMGWRIPVPTAR